MSLRHSFRSLLLLAVLAGSVAVGSAQAAPQIWSGRTFAFAKASGANPSLPANQDRITPLIWITRGSTQGIYNAQSEVSFAHFLSPAGTTWATGDAANYASLTFTDWDSWVGVYGGPPATVGVNACVHLVAEDIYVDIVFDSWQSIGGGAFSYHRGVSQATPTEQSTWGAIKALYR